MSIWKKSSTASAQKSPEQENKMEIKTFFRMEAGERFFELAGHYRKIARVRKALKLYRLWQKCRRAQPASTMVGILLNIGFYAYLERKAKATA